MTLQMERGENEEGRCVATNTSQKEQKYKEPCRKENKLCINLGWLSYIYINQMCFVKVQMCCSSLGIFGLYALK